MEFGVELLEGREGGSLMVGLRGLAAWAGLWRQ